jgi:hypothetical protein
MTTTQTPGKTTYRVAPIDGAWVIELVGDSVREHASYKAEAIARARELAERAPDGAVAVFDASGKLESQFDVHRTAST